MGVIDFCASLDNNKSTSIKSGNPMLPVELQSTLNRNGGMVFAAQANKAGISNERLRLLVKAGELERVAFGVYALPDRFVDEMFAAQTRCAKIIYSHETALFLHDLTDRDPLDYTVTVPTGYNASRLRERGFTVFTIKRELHLLGVTKLTTLFGHRVVAYDLERTLCDCLRNRNKMDIAVVTDAVKRYVRRSDKNLNVLMRMAETFCVAKLLRNYMEVLL
ncbi:MAG: type IV toxin-antitoxin system AbiEi family antitoxin domain-containing protein [Burkholderiales bacterium]|jgi:predicted transcriptional regulator of viral defense system|nr:type IV toxin-antitoxin system AbiEi family antitoxin domain-containing protein [Burkholderiales bacterium]